MPSRMRVADEEETGEDTNEGVDQAELNIDQVI